MSLERSLETDLEASSSFFDQLTAPGTTLSSSIFYPLNVYTNTVS